MEFCTYDFSLRVVGKVNCDFSQMNCEKNLVNFSSCHPLTINLCLIDLIEMRCLLDVKKSFQLFCGPGGF
jgi:hypothetical protein